MPYDELGHYIPDSVALDEMRYELARRGSMPVRESGSDVPYVTSEAPQRYVAKPPPVPASSATNFAQAIADKFGISAVPQAIAAMASGFGSEVAKGMGFPEASKAMQYEPTSKMARDLLEAAEQAPKTITGSSMGFGPLPEAWFPMTRGMSPEDLQVMRGQTKRVAGEMRDIPTDFANAQSGVRRQNVFGEPTLGVKAEGVASDVGDVLARRQAAGKSSLPGVPEGMFPETNLYAVRNTGEGQLLTPTDRPGVDTRNITNYGQIARVNEAALGFSPQTFREQPVEQFNRYLDEFINPESVPESIRKGWSKYFAGRVQDLFPEATERHDATSAWSQLVSPEQQTKYKMQFLDDFVAKPENKQLATAAGQDLPSVEEYKTRVEAADKWLKGPFAKYVQKFVGTKDDPLLQLAERGLTAESPEVLLQEAQDFSSSRMRVLESRREKAGFNPKGEYFPEIERVTSELETANNEQFDLSTQQNAIARQLAETNPGEDPAALSPEFAKLSNEVTSKVNYIDKLEQKLENLKLAQAYETMSDYSITPQTAGEIKQDMTFVESQLFPGLTKTPDAAKMIELIRAGTGGSGIESAAKQYVNDIITGKLPINQISNTSFEKHVGKQAGVRAQADQVKKNAEKAKITALNDYAKGVVEGAPEYLRFGNANVVEFNKTMQLDQIRKGLSFETEMLDHCLGSGGSGAGRKHFITGEDRIHTPIIDPITGEVPKGSSGNDRGYVDHVRSGKTEIASVRDINTGYPAVTIEFNKYGKGKYNIGYVSGYQNQVPEPEYRNATRDYLNSRADEIEGIGSNLTLYGIYDQRGMTDHKLAEITGLNSNEVSMAQLAEQLHSAALPRFLTQNDLIKAVSGEVVDIPPLPARPSREMLPAVANDAVNIQVREYRSWLNDRYPDIRERLSQINEDISNINNGRVGAGQYGLTEEQFPNFANELSNYSDQLRAQYENPNVTPANALDGALSMIADTYAPGIVRSVTDYVNSARHEFNIERRPQEFLNELRTASENLIGSNNTAQLTRGHALRDLVQAIEPTLTQDTPANPLVDLYGREVANISRDLSPATLDETINHLRGITNMSRFRDEPQAFISRLRERSRFLNAGDPTSNVDTGVQRDVGRALGALANQLERGVPEAPVQVRDDNGMNRLMREEQVNVDRAWEEVLQETYDYENMMPAEIRTQAASLRRDPQSVLGRATNEFFLNPGFVEGLARQIDEQARMAQEMVGGNDLDEALNDSLQAIRGIHGEQTFNRTIEIANDISNRVNLTDDPELYVSRLRAQADVYQGDMRAALINLADDLEAAHMQNWEPEDIETRHELLPHERPLQPFAPQSNDPAAYRDYYTSEATGANRGFDHVIQAERMTPGAIQEAIRRTDGAAMYDADIMQFYGVDSPAGVSQINHALRRYVEGRGEAQPQLPAPARGREADHLPAVPDIPMGENFLSDAIDTMLDDDHIDGIMEMYRGVAEDIDTLSDRGSQRDILRRVRQYADQMEDMGDQEFANAINEVADRMRAAIIQASGRPEGHKKGGYISKKQVYFAENPDAMRYEILRNK